MYFSAEFEADEIEFFFNFVFVWQIGMMFGSRIYED